MRWSLPSLRSSRNNCHTFFRELSTLLEMVMYRGRGLLPLGRELGSMFAGLYLSFPSSQVRMSCCFLEEMSFSSRVGASTVRGVATERRGLGPAMWQVQLCAEEEVAGGCARVEEPVFEGGG